MSAIAVPAVVPAAPLADLARDVRLRVSHPVDHLEIAAVLESIGITDAIAREDYAATDTFELATHVFAELVEPAGGDASARVSFTPGDRSRPAVADALRGTLALAPLIALAAVFLVLTGDGWSGERVAALAAGMGIAMVPTGGFIQAVLRRTSIYLGLEDRTLAARFVLRGTLVGFAAIVALTGAVVVAAGAAGRLAPPEQLLLTVGAVAFAGFWLPAAVLVVAQAGRWIVYALTSAAVCGLAAGQLATVEVGLLVGYCASLGTLLLGALRAYGPGVRRGRRETLPPLWGTLFELRPYFAYGALLMALLVEPYALAWLAARPDGVTRLEAVRFLGAPFTFALVPLLLATGAAERTLRLFWLEARELQEATAATAARQFRTELLHFHRRRLAGYVAVNAALSLVALVAFAALLRLDAFPTLLAPADPATTQVVFALGLLAFWQLGVGQFNCMLLVSLGRPLPALRSVLGGVIALAVVGVPLGFVGYELTPIAFVVGTAVFALLSLRACERALARADYHYATAF